MLLIRFLLGILPVARGQELFILNEPASSMPKNTLGVRLFGNTFREVSVLRNVGALRFMYGVTPKLTVMVTGNVSNHHDTILPRFLADHIHHGDHTIVSSGEVKRGQGYPYLFNGITVYAKYRAVTIDRQNRHFRMAGYLEAGFLRVANDKAEPGLVDDTRGIGGGILSTYLVRKFAVSLNAGFILPFKYNGYQLDDYYGAFPNVPTTVHYGNALVYNLSMGYLFLPLRYKSYNQTNLNLYMEVIGRAYGGARIFQENEYGTFEADITSPLLKPGNYVELHPGIQLIVRSNLRLDFAVGFPVVSRSWGHYYPFFNFGLQRYFYL